MIGGEIGRPGRELDRARARRCRCPTGGPAASRVVAQQLVEQLVDPVEAALRAGRDVGRLVVVAEDPAVEAS